MNHRPTTRVLAALELLQTHRRMSGAELAQRLGVSPRTVRRYVGALEDIGVPITAEQGRSGAYALVAGFKLPPMMFTDDEALALSIGLLAARELGIADAVPAVESAQAKLERVMPEPVRQRIAEIGGTVRLDLARPRSDAHSVPLGALSAAAHAQRRVRIRYESQSGDTTWRELDPYGMSYQRGRWYAVGLCHLRQAMRTFRLDRIGEVIPLQQSFQRPDGFDVLDFITRSFAAMPRTYAVEVLLAADLGTVNAQPVAKLGVLEPCNEGVLLRTRTDHVDWLARMLATLPFEFRIHAPQELTAAMREVTARLARAVPTVD